MRAVGRRRQDPLRRSFRHLRRVADRLQRAVSRSKRRQPVGGVREIDVRRGKAVGDAAHVTQPQSGPRQRDAHVPAAALVDPADERRDRAERHQIAGGMVDRLAGQGLEQKSRYWRPTRRNLYPVCLFKKEWLCKNTTANQKIPATSRITRRYLIMHRRISAMDPAPSPTPKASQANQQERNSHIFGPLHDH